MSKLKLIELSAPWCGVCKMIQPTVKRFMDKYPDVEFECLDVETGEGSKVADEFNLKTVPTFLFYKDGVCVHKHIGNIALGELEIKLNELK